MATNRAALAHGLDVVPLPPGVSSASPAHPLPWGPLAFLTEQPLPLPTNRVQPLAAPGGDWRETGFLRVPLQSPWAGCVTQKPQLVVSGTGRIPAWFLGLTSSCCPSGPGRQEDIPRPRTCPPPCPLGLTSLSTKRSHWKGSDWRVPSASCQDWW